MFFFRKIINWLKQTLHFSIYCICANVFLCLIKHFLAKNELRKEFVRSWKKLRKTMNLLKFSQIMEKQVLNFFLLWSIIIYNNTFFYESYFREYLKIHLQHHIILQSSLFMTTCSFFLASNSFIGSKKFLSIHPSLSVIIFATFCTFPPTTTLLLTAKMLFICFML